MTSAEVGQALLKACWRGDATTCLKQLERWRQTLGYDAVAEGDLPTDKDGYSPLHCTVSGGHEKATAALLQAGLPPNLQDQSGSTPLHVAAAKGSKPVAELLLKYNASVTAVTNFGWTPLHSAAFWGQAAVAEVLLAAGCDVTTPNSAGQSALTVALQSSKANSWTVSLLNDHSARIDAKAEKAKVPKPRSASRPSAKQYQRSATSPAPHLTSATPSGASAQAPAYHRAASQNDGGRAAAGSSPLYLHRRHSPERLEDSRRTRSPAEDSRSPPPGKRSPAAQPSTRQPSGTGSAVRQRVYARPLSAPPSPDQRSPPTKTPPRPKSPHARPEHFPDSTQQFHTKLHEQTGIQEMRQMYYSHGNWSEAAAQRREKRVSEAQMRAAHEAAHMTVERNRRDAYGRMEDELARGVRREEERRAWAEYEDSLQRAARAAEYANKRAEVEFRDNQIQRRGRMAARREREMKAARDEELHGWERWRASHTQAVLRTERRRLIENRMRKLRVEQDASSVSTACTVGGVTPIVHSVDARDRLEGGASAASAGGPHTPAGGAEGAGRLPAPAEEDERGPEDPSGQIPIVVDHIQRLSKGELSELCRLLQIDFSRQNEKRRETVRRCITMAIPHHSWIEVDDVVSALEGVVHNHDSLPNGVGELAGIACIPCMQLALQMGHAELKHLCKLLGVNYGGTRNQALRNLIAAFNELALATRMSKLHIN